jgi:hypothetical protein
MKVLFVCDGNICRSPLAAAYLRHRAASEGLGNIVVDSAGLLGIEGAPVLIHTIRKFLRCPSVHEIVVALRAEDMDWARGLIHAEHAAKPVRVVEGGDSRQQDAREQGGIQDCEVSRRIRAVTDPQAGSVMVWPGVSWPRAILGN